MKLEGYTNTTENRLNTAIMCVVRKRKIDVATFWADTQKLLPQPMEKFGLSDLPIDTKIDMLINLTYGLYK